MKGVNVFAQKQTEPSFPIASCTVDIWSDVVVDQLGHDPRSAYVERYWLPILGPSTVFLLRLIADGFDQHNGPFQLDLVQVSMQLGIGMRGGKNSPMVRTLERCRRFGAARLMTTNSFEVRRRLAPLTRSQVSRLPEKLQRDHEQWLTRTDNNYEQLKQRFRSLALALYELDNSAQQIEKALHAQGAHPAMAYDAVRWAFALQRPLISSEAQNPLPVSAADELHSLSHP